MQLKQGEIAKETAYIFAGYNVCVYIITHKSTCFFGGEESLGYSFFFLVYCSTEFSFNGSSTYFIFHENTAYCRLAFRCNGVTIATYEPHTTEALLLQQNLVLLYCTVLGKKKTHKNINYST